MTLRPEVLRAAVAGQLTRQSPSASPQLLAELIDARMTLLSRCNEADALTWLGLSVEQAQSADMLASAAFADLDRRAERKQS